MTALNSTVSASALIAAVDVDADKVRKPLTLSGIVLRDALRAVKDNEESNWNLITSVVAMTVDAICRNVHDKLPLGDQKGDAVVPPMVKTAKAQVLRTLRIKTVLTGRPVYLGSAEGVARILAMPRDTKQQRNLRTAQAAILVDSTWFHNGFPVPAKVNPAKDTSGQYIGATQKANVQAFALAQKYSGFIVDWFWNNNQDLIQDFAKRVPADHTDGPAPFVDLTPADLDSIRSHISTTFGENMTQLQESYAAGRPKTVGKTKMESMRDAFGKLSMDEMQEFLSFAQTKFAEMVRSAENAAKAAGLNEAADDDIEDVMAEAA